MSVSILAPFILQAAIVDHLEPFVLNLPEETLTICGYEAIVEALVFTPDSATEIYSAKAANGDLCAEVYVGAFYRGTLWLDRGSGTAKWSSSSGESTSYDMSSHDAAQIVAAHTPLSVALSAMLHLEDEKPDPKLYEKSSCSYRPNGCTASPQDCGGISIRSACDNHDWCYQCGWSQGRTRSDCDIEFFQEIYQLTSGNGDCASAYYWGVRVLGWLFFQDPNAPVNRLHYWGDVYALGISMNACSGTQYERMCTTYIY